MSAQILDAARGGAATPAANRRAIWCTASVSTSTPNAVLARNRLSLVAARLAPRYALSLMQ